MNWVGFAKTLRCTLSAPAFCVDDNRADRGVGPYNTDGTGQVFRRGYIPRRVFP